MGWPPLPFHTPRFAPRSSLAPVRLRSAGRLDERSKVRQT